MSETPWAVHSETQRRADGALPEIRCRRCGRLLLKGEIKRVEVKCPKCGYLQRAGSHTERPQA